MLKRSSHQATKTKRRVMRQGRCAFHFVSESHNKLREGGRGKLSWGETRRREARGEREGQKTHWSFLALVSCELRLRHVESRFRISECRGPGKGIKEKAEKEGELWAGSETGAGVRLKSSLVKNHRKVVTRVKEKSKGAANKKREREKMNSTLLLFHSLR